MIVRTEPVGQVGGRLLVRPAQGTSDSSAYVISRRFAEQALAIHVGYGAPLDVALFDPAICPAIAQLDPAITIQQRYADFRFLDEAAPRTDIQPDRALGGRPRPDPLTAVRREAARFWRRRIVPAAQPLLNLARLPGDRQAFRRIAFQA